MDQATHNKIVSFIWGVADDVLRDLFKRGKNLDVILPMCVPRRMDAVLELTKKAKFETKEMLDSAGIADAGRCACRHGKRLGIDVGANKFRNSYISYRVALTHDVAKVALESGNSPRVIQREYLELATEEEGKRWFAVVPKASTGTMHSNAPKKPNNRRKKPSEIERGKEEVDSR